MKRVLAISVAIAAAALGGSCKTEENAAPTLVGEALLDPNNCLPCHADQFREWSGSMHAYAGEDPVFVAMNRRMQRETNGAAGDFCVKCHAPVAVKLGMTKDGLNLAELPSAVRGVTCYFCHSADGVASSHNNGVHLADDGALRGAIRDPASSMPHRGTYSALHDRETPDSAKLCGGCHDVVTPQGAHIERTFLEWQTSLYSQPGQLSCGKCHMEGRDGVAAKGAGPRKVHDHSMAAVDIALTPFFGAEEQRAAVQRALDATLLAKLCVRRLPTGIVVEVNLDNAFAGHGFPSGANQDRRAWVELVASLAGQPIFTSGKVPDRIAVASTADPNLFLLRDKIFDTTGKEVHMFWQAARFESSQLGPALTSDPLDPRFNHSVTRTYPLTQIPDKVTMRVKMRPLDFELLDDLVKTGDLDPKILDRVPTYEIQTAAREWTTQTGLGNCVTN